MSLISTLTYSIFYILHFMSRMEETRKRKLDPRPPEADTKRLRPS